LRIPVIVRDAAALSEGTDIRLLPEFPFQRPLNRFRALLDGAHVVHFNHVVALRKGRNGLGGLGGFRRGGLGGWWWCRVVVKGIKAD
jgi:hypothetical protein